MNSEEEILKNIRDMQARETALYEKLEDPKRTPDERAELIDIMNNLAQARIQLYTIIHDVYAVAQDNAVQSTNTSAQQLTALKVIEDQMDDMKQKQNAMRSARTHQLRLVGINTYYGKKYQAYTRIMKAIVLTCLPLILIRTLNTRGLFSDEIATVATGIVLFFGGLTTIVYIIDYTSRDSMNFDQYKWSFDADSAPEEDTSSAVVPWNESNDTSSTCVGAECCADTMIYDTESNACKPKDVDSIACTAAPIKETMISGPIPNMFVPMGIKSK